MKENESNKAFRELTSLIVSEEKFYQKIGKYLPQILIVTIIVLVVVNYVAKTYFKIEIF